jgi:hypothetical protein
MSTRKKTDKILQVGKSPLDEDGYWEQVDQVDGFVEPDVEMIEEDNLSISGKVELGMDGHPVTITIVDEITGAEMEINHVKNGLFLIEDSRTNSSGWLSMLIGDIRKIGDVLRFISRATLSEIKRMSGRDKSRRS